MTINTRKKSFKTEIQRRANYGRTYEAMLQNHRYHGQQSPRRLVFKGDRPIIHVVFRNDQFYCFSQLGDHVVLVLILH